MHNFIYPVQNSYITNESGYANSNFSLDSILEVKAVNQLTQFTTYYITQSISQSINNQCNGIIGYTGYLSGGLFTGSAIYANVFVSGSSNFSSTSYTGYFTGSTVTAYSGSLMGVVSGSVSGSLSGSIKFISGSITQFTGSFSGSLNGTQSIYQPYNTSTLIPYATSRTLMQFDLTSISQSISNGSISNTGSLKFYLNLKTANVKEVPLKYTLYAYPLLQSWNIGDGRYQLGGSDNGVSWNYADYNGGTNWISSSTGGYYTTSSNLSSLQFFNHRNSDVKMDITPMAKAWLSGSIVNNGLILLTSLENSSQINDNTLQFFSTETNTIYSPYLDTYWDDSIYNTGSLTPITTARSFNLIIQDMVSEYRFGSIPRIDVFARDNNPLKNYIKALQLSQYTTSSYLPKNTFYSIVDNESSEVIIDFDVGTRLSCDGNINYFLLDTTGLPQERYYRIILKTFCPDGRVNVYDNGNIFKIVRNDSYNSIFPNQLTSQNISSLNAPVLSNVSTPGQLQTDLSWTSPMGAVTYHVKRSLTVGGPYTTIATTSGTTYSDTTISSDTDYYYVVSATDGSSESNNSNEIYQRETLVT